MTIWQPQLFFQLDRKVRQIFQLSLNYDKTQIPTRLLDTCDRFRDLMHQHQCLNKVHLPVLKTCYKCLKNLAILVLGGKKTPIDQILSWNLLILHFTTHLSTWVSCGKLWNALCLWNNDEWQGAPSVYKLSTFSKKAGRDFFFGSNFRTIHTPEIYEIITLNNKGHWTHLEAKVCFWKINGIKKSPHKKIICLELLKFCWIIDVKKDVYC